MHRHQIVIRLCGHARGYVEEGGCTRTAAGTELQLNGNRHGVLRRRREVNLRSLLRSEARAADLCRCAVKLNLCWPTAVLFAVGESEHNRVVVALAVVAAVVALAVLQHLLEAKIAGNRGS